MTIETGGPAFPTEHKTQDGTWKFHGMTLRDYFAGKELSKVDFLSPVEKCPSYELLAQHCYRMADAMLLERDK